MKTLKQIGNKYFFVFDETNKEYEIYYKDELLACYDEKDYQGAKRDFDNLVGKGELLANEKQSNESPGQ